MSVMMSASAATITKAQQSSCQCSAVLDLLQGGSRADVAEKSVNGCARFDGSDSESMLL